MRLPVTAFNLSFAESVLLISCPLGAIEISLEVKDVCQSAEISVGDEGFFDPQILASLLETLRKPNLSSAEKEKLLQTLTLYQAINLEGSTESAPIDQKIEWLTIVVEQLSFCQE